MGDAENALPPSKKRAAGREISRDNPGLDDEEDSSEQEAGTFKRASEEVLANRRIVKVRRNQTPSTPSSNPFSGIRLVPPTEPTVAPAAPSVPESTAATTEVTAEAPIATEKEVSEDGKNDASKSQKNEDGDNQQSEIKIDETEPESAKNESENVKQSESKGDEPVSEAVGDKESAVDKDSNVANEETEKVANDEKPVASGKTEDEDKKDDKNSNEENKEKSSENTESTAEGASLSSFQQLSSSQNAFTGLAGTGFSTSSFSFGSASKDGSTSSVPIFGQKSDQPSFGFGFSTNGNSSLLAGTPIVSKSEGSGFPAMPEVPVETGEENEKVVFSADSALFEFIDGGWKERGKGELKVNVSTTGTEKARLLMRARGNYRLILNASLYPDMKLTNMDKKGITFACMNSTGEVKEGLSTFALKFKDASIVEEFRATVTTHKGKTADVLKTPENSP
ncbi:hypothetical protein COLO4_30356 [Corchorus olitorius]|uniref:RanBD1 domain-containing protein n=1 Tax=Corchorus olitorius TaxID=93759 RepID=A0A1R3H8V3_9ROSI|nr:hypothetical protein COLO4_30356 [Corchorus olitorius]